MTANQISLRGLMTARWAFYGGMVVGFVTSFLTVLFCGFRENSLPQWTLYVFFPGHVAGFLAWWTYGLGERTSMLLGCAVTAFSYGVVGLCVQWLASSCFRCRRDMRRKTT